MAASRLLSFIKPPVGEIKPGKHVCAYSDCRKPLYWDGACSTPSDTGRLVNVHVECVRKRVGD